MEDAMIINKSSSELGFARGCVYKIKKIDLSKKNTSTVKYEFAAKSNHFVSINEGYITPRKEKFGNSISSNKGNETPYESIKHNSYSKKTKTIDNDGLPILGTLISPGSVLYTFVNSN